MCCHVRPKKALGKDSCLHDSPWSEKKSIGSYQSENIWTVLFWCLMLSLWCLWADGHQTRPPSFRVDSAFLSLCSPSPRSSAPPLMNSSAHLLSSTSTLTPTTGAILMEKRSLSKHGEPHQIDLSTSAPLSTPCSESRPICISTQCQRILNLLPLTPWHIVNSPWGSQKQPSWVPRLHATVSFTTFRNEAVEMHGRFLCWRKREWNWEPWPVHPPRLIRHYYCTSSQTPCWDGLPQIQS